MTQSLNLSIMDLNEPKELMPNWGYIVSASVLFLIGFFGFFLNLIVIILMCKDKQLWTPLNVILFNLVCSDFSVSILGNPFTLLSAIHHRWIFGKTMCVIYGFFMTLLGITSITTLTVLSFERYIMVSRPLTTHHLSMRGSFCCVCLIWCYSFIVTTPPLYGWGKYVNEAANISCSINWEEQTLNALSYILFLFAMGLILPVTIITFSYINILKTMKRNAMRVGKVARAESRVTVMVFVMIVTFMIAWTPYSIYALIEQFATHDLITPGMGVIPALLAKSSICYDPIIYAGMNTQFRSSLNRIFGFRFRDNFAQRRAQTTMSPTRAVSHTVNENLTLQYMKPNNNLDLDRSDTNKKNIIRSLWNNNSNNVARNNKNDANGVEFVSTENDTVDSSSEHKEIKVLIEAKKSDLDSDRSIVHGIDNPLSELFPDNSEDEPSKPKSSERRPIVSRGKIKKKQPTRRKSHGERSHSSGIFAFGRLVVDERDRSKLMVMEEAIRAEYFDDSN